MNAPSLRIAYVPNAPDLSPPGDRRRFCYYARKRQLNWEVYREGASYDVIVLSPLADLTRWARLPRGGARIVYDMPDSYLEIDDEQWKARWRGAAKFVFRQHRHLELNYRGSLMRMFGRADAVTCSTEEQRTRIAQLNANTYPILDFHTEEILRVKENYARKSDTLHLFWEGIGGNLIVFDEVSAALVRLSERQKVVLHLFTDVWSKPFNGPVPRLPTRRLLKSLDERVPTFMYEWNTHMLAHVATACDLALIPIVMDHPLYRSKPENKLLLLWRMGMPTITSATPAYVRTMDKAGVSMYANDSKEWEHLIATYGADEEARRNSAEAASRFVREEHSETNLLAKWDAVFTSLMH